MVKEPTLIDINDLLLHVVAHMATKEEMEKGFAAIREEMATKKDLADGLAAVRREMADGFVAVRGELRSEIGEVKGRLDDVEAAIENLAGLTKETDDLYARMNTVERHVGLQGIS